MSNHYPIKYQTVVTTWENPVCWQTRRKRRSTPWMVTVLVAREKWMPFKDGHQAKKIVDNAATTGSIHHDFVTGNKQIFGQLSLGGIEGKYACRKTVFWRSVKLVPVTSDDSSRSPVSLVVSRVVFMVGMIVTILVGYRRTRVEGKVVLLMSWCIIIFLRYLYSFLSFTQWLWLPIPFFVLLTWWLNMKTLLSFHFSRSHNWEGGEPEGASI